MCIQQWTFWLHKILGIFWAAEQLASQVLRSMELICQSDLTCYSIIAAYSYVEFGVVLFAVAVTLRKRWHILCSIGDYWAHINTCILYGKHLQFSDLLYLSIVRTTFLQQFPHTFPWATTLMWRGGMHALIVWRAMIAGVWALGRIIHTRPTEGWGWGWC